MRQWSVALLEAFLAGAGVSQCVAIAVYPFAGYLEFLELRCASVARDEILACGEPAVVDQRDRPLQQRPDGLWVPASSPLFTCGSRAPALFRRSGRRKERSFYGSLDESRVSIALPPSVGTFSPSAWP